MEIHWKYYIYINKQIVKKKNIKFWVFLNQILILVKFKNEIILYNLYINISN